MRFHYNNIDCLLGNENCHISPYGSGLIIVVLPWRKLKHRDSFGEDQFKKNCSTCDKPYGTIQIISEQLSHFGRKLDLWFNNNYTLQIK